MSFTCIQVTFQARRGHRRSTILLVVHATQQSFQTALQVPTRPIGRGAVTHPMLGGCSHRTGAYRPCMGPPPLASGWVTRKSDMGVYTPVRGPRPAVALGKRPWTALASPKRTAAAAPSKSKRTALNGLEHLRPGGPRRPWPSWHFSRRRMAAEVPHGGHPGNAGGLEEQLGCRLAQCRR